MAVLGTAGCQARTSLAVDVREDGSGTVSVTLSLDDDAMARYPGIAGQLRTDDLQAAGWTLSGPTEDADGLTVFRLSKPFTTPEEATAILADVAGPAGALRDFSLVRDRSFAQTQFEFTGLVDLSGGLESFGDAGLAQALDGEPLGEDVAAIEARLGAPIDQAFVFRVAVQLPGDVSSNAPEQSGGLAVWEPALSDPAPVELQASSQSWRPGTLLWLAVAGAAALALVLLLGWRLIARIRRPPAASPSSD